jgi:hypothetical protein
MPGESHGITLKSPVGKIVLEEDAEVHGMLLLCFAPKVHCWWFGLWKRSCGVGSSSRANPIGWSLENAVRQGWGGHPVFAKIVAFEYRGA